MSTETRERLTLEVEPDGGGYVATLYDEQGLDAWRGEPCRTRREAADQARMIAEQVGAVIAG